MLCTLVNGDGLCVHDEILLEAPIEATDELVLILKDTMEEAGKEFSESCSSRG